MRIGGGIGPNEGDTPIYVANIHPHGCIGKSKQLKVSSVFGNISKGSPGHPKFWQQKNRVYFQETQNQGFCQLLLTVSSEIHA